MNPSFDNDDTPVRNIYQAAVVIGRAANRNKPPKTFLLKRVLKVSLVIGPILAWLLWLY